MRNARVTEHRIITVLKSVEAGRTVKDVCRPQSGMLRTESRYWKKTLKPVIKRELVSYLKETFSMSTRQACRTLSLSRTVYFYQPDTRRDAPVIEALMAAAERYRRYGFKKLFQVIRR